MAAAVVLPIVGLIAIGLRFYTKSTQSIQVGADDWWNAASLVSNSFDRYQSFY